jgi:hypothetical protein
LILFTRFIGANVNPKQLLVVFVILVSSFAAATIAVASIDLRVLPTAEHVVVLKLSDLRSAYLLRESIVRYDSSDMTPDGIRRQLERHFNTVLGLLTVATPRSIETALDRLEATAGQSWTSDERAGWRQRLLANRFMQMRRLALYRDRGLFPQNEGQADHAVPIFVDRHDTACAVGQLMRFSGQQESVADIERDNNLVYVPDAGDSAIARWVLDSGLTLEEAALIQPGYGFSAPYLVSDYGTGGATLTNNGLKYENFHVERHNYLPVSSNLFHAYLTACGNGTSCGLFTETSPPPPTFAKLGFNAGFGMLFGFYGDQFDPVGTHWLTMGGELDTVGPPPTIEARGIVGGANSFGGVQHILISFDISTTQQNKFINLIAEHSFPTYGGLHSDYAPQDWPGQFEFSTFADSAGSNLGSANAQEDAGNSSPPFFSTVIASSGIAKSSHVTVTTSLWLYNTEALNGYVLGFQMVPEPSTIVLYALCAPALMIVRRHQLRPARG